MVLMLKNPWYDPTDGISVEYYEVRNLPDKDGFRFYECVNTLNVFAVKNGKVITECGSVDSCLQNIKSRQLA